MPKSEIKLAKRLGTWDVFVAGVALVVAASTLVTDFQGFFTLGWGFVIALALAGVVNLVLGMSVADLAVSHPRAGALYDYAKTVFRGTPGIVFGTILGITFICIFAFGYAGELTAGAYGAKAFLQIDMPVEYYVISLAVIAAIPNLFGIKEAAWFSALLLCFMLGIRVFFGLSGYFGWGNVGEWEAANMIPQEGMPSLFGGAGILVAGLAYAFWSFVGVEYACALAEEVKDPKRSIPFGLMAGIVVIFVVAVIMGGGLLPTAPLADWRVLAESDIACGGDCPQLAIGMQVHGQLGYNLMALSSAAATLGTITVALAAVPRLIYSISRDGMFFGRRTSDFFGRLHPKSHTPINATFFATIILVIPGIVDADVIPLVFAAAYVWILIYIAYHCMCIANRKLHPETNHAFGSWFSWVPYFGIASTAITLYYAFLGTHSDYGVKALLMIGFASVVAGLGISFSGRQAVLDAERKEIETEELEATSTTPASASRNQENIITQSKNIC